MELHVVIDGDKDLAGPAVPPAAGTRSAPAGWPRASSCRRRGCWPSSWPSRARRCPRPTRGSPSTSCWSAASASAPSSPAGAARAAAAPRACPLASAAVVEQWRRMDTPLRHPAPAGSARYEFIGGAPARSLFPHADWRRCMLHALREGGALARPLRTGRGPAGAARGDRAPRRLLARRALHARRRRRDQRRAAGAGPGGARAGRARQHGWRSKSPAIRRRGCCSSAQGARGGGRAGRRRGHGGRRDPGRHAPDLRDAGAPVPAGHADERSAAARRCWRAPTRSARSSIEDDYDSEFRYEGRPTDSLQSLDATATWPSSARSRRRCRPSCGWAT